MPVIRVAQRQVAEPVGPGALPDVGKAPVFEAMGRAAEKIAAQGFALAEDIIREKAIAENAVAQGKVQQIIFETNQQIEEQARLGGNAMEDPREIFNVMGKRIVSEASAAVKTGMGSRTFNNFLAQNMPQTVAELSKRAINANRAFQFDTIMNSRAAFEDTAGSFGEAERAVGNISVLLQDAADAKTINENERKRLLDESRDRAWGHAAEMELAQNTPAAADRILSGVLTGRMSPTAEAALRDRAVSDMRKWAENQALDGMREIIETPMLELPDGPSHNDQVNTRIIDIAARREQLTGLTKRLSQLFDQTQMRKFHDSFNAAEEQLKMLRDLYDMGRQIVEVGGIGASDDLSKRAVEYYIQASSPRLLTESPVVERGRGARGLAPSGR